MSDTLINIRVGYYHFKLYKTFPFLAIEANDYWVHYYSFKGEKNREPFFCIYQFFSF